MNVQSETRDGQAITSPARTKVLVWDLPVRAFHWLIALSFAGAWLTAEGDQWRLLHVTLGYTMAILVAFRILWGLAGTRYARFSSFVRGPSAVARYLGGVLRGRPQHYVGHNPAGAVAIVAMLGLALAVALSGWATYTGAAGGWTEEVHEAIASVMLGVVVVHIAGVLASSWLHRENLVRAMIDGRKEASPKSGIRGPQRTVAGLLVAAVLAFWWVQWHNPAAVEALVGTPAAEHAGHGDDD